MSLPIRSGLHHTVKSHVMRHFSQFMLLHNVCSAISDQECLCLCTCIVIACESVALLLHKFLRLVSHALLLCPPSFLTSSSSLLPLLSSSLLPSFPPYPTLLPFLPSFPFLPSSSSLLPLPSFPFPPSPSLLPLPSSPFPIPPSLLPLSSFPFPPSPFLLPLPSSPFSPHPYLLAPCSSLTHSHHTDGSGHQDD